MFKKLLIGVISVITLCLTVAVFAAEYDVTVNDVTVNETGVTVTLTSAAGAEANVMAVSYGADGMCGIISFALFAMCIVFLCQSLHLYLILHLCRSLHLYLNLRLRRVILRETV